MKKNSIYSNLLYSIYIIIPFLLITGPALPDIFLTLFSIIFIFFYFRKLNNTKIELWMILIILLWIWFIIISFFAVDIYLSLTDAVIFLRFILFIIFSYLFLKHINIKFLKYILYSILCLCLFVSLDTFYQFYNFSNENGFGEDIFGRKPEGLYGRLSGPFSDLVTGSYLSRFIFFIIFLFLLEKKFILENKYLYFFVIFSLSLIVSAIYFSGERMALATTFLGFLLCFVFSKNLKKIILFSSMLSIIFIIININYHPYYNNYKIIKSTAKHEGLIIERNYVCENNNKCSKKFKVQPKFFTIIKNFNNSAYADIYLTSYNMWKDNILFGIGLNNFNFLCNKNAKYINNKSFGCTTHPHNIYLQALVESGFIGFLIFCFFAFSLFKKIFKSSNPDQRIVLIATLLTVFWPLMSTGSFLKNWNMTTICIICSICLVLSQINKSQSIEFK